MNTNLFLDLDDSFVPITLPPFVNIRVHSWLKFLFLKSTRPLDHAPVDVGQPHVAPVETIGQLS